MNIFASAINGNKYIGPLTAFAVVLGGLIGLSLKTQINLRQQSLPSNRFPGLASAYLDQQSKLKDANSEIARLRIRITKYENEMSSASGRVELINQSLQEAKFLSGLTEVQGPGVEVVLQDSKKRNTGMTGLALENYIIHDVDIQRMVNELHAAGCEAVSVNGQRVVANTAIRCVGPSIQVNGIALSPPYIIKAIGDADGMATALDMLGGLIKDVEAVDPLMIQLTKKTLIVVPAYNGSSVFRFAKPVKAKNAETEVPQ